MAFENLNRVNDHKTSSNRELGFVFSGFFAIVGLFKFWQLDFASLNYKWFLLSLVMLLLALICPSVLGPLNRLWTKFGILLHKITNPLIMGFLFYGIMTPIGVLGRRMGWDPLKLKKNPKSATYWVMRENPSSDLKNQF